MRTHLHHLGLSVVMSGLILALAGCAGAPPQHATQTGGQASADLAPIHPEILVFGVPHTY